MPNAFETRRRERTVPPAAWNGSLAYRTVERSALAADAERADVSRVRIVTSGRSWTVADLQARIARDAE